MIMGSSSRQNTVDVSAEATVPLITEIDSKSIQRIIIVCYRVHKEGLRTFVNLEVPNFRAEKLRFGQALQVRNTQFICAVRSVIS